jgi:hypothetical protein
MDLAALADLLHETAEHHDLHDLREDASYSDLCPIERVRVGAARWEPAAPLYRAGSGEPGSAGLSGEV